jgi:hypothetical protein
MIRRTSKYLAATAMIGFACAGNAGTGAVTPALAACSKALIETMSRTETLPTYKVKAPSSFKSDLVDPNSFTVFARHAKTNELLAKASCKATQGGEIVAFRSLPVKS